MRDIRAEILSMLHDGPVLRRRLRGRGAAFRLAYDELLKAGEIQERSSSLLPFQPVYVCLPEQELPALRITRPRRYDVRLLMDVGYSRQEAVQAILGNDFNTVLGLLAAAEAKCGLRTKRRPGRPRNITKLNV